ncbi:hypothetical protein F6X40_27780 [Paraburkholderia sp. UCT31]|uniref:hypothetical protein n=1 Tax=Paraburkholderia sp. UCT31 TaxID=2615209 RepID=UPI0016564C96|nr:hypothetical protein [Paraburkholderia sp. UCT31]MBC8740440.1 hypothetical protein [Paraburkholderia sp. UCT31]
MKNPLKIAAFIISSIALTACTGSPLPTNATLTQHFAESSGPSFFTSHQITRLNISCSVDGNPKYKVGLAWVDRYGDRFLSTDDVCERDGALRIELGTGTNGKYVILSDADYSAELLDKYVSKVIEAERPKPSL